jgi:hypothetical protein
MLRSAALLSVAVLLAPPAFAQKVVATDLASHPFTTDFAAGGKLRLRVRSAEVHILGTAEDRISVEVDGRPRDVRKMKVEFDREGTAGDLRICGGSGEDLTITIRIPSHTDLHARIPFGEVRVENVTGSKDVSLHAGELTVDVGDPEDYARVEASVLTGELDAAPFDEYTGGLFRSFRTSGSGRYRLYAHVGAGELTLR